MDTKLSNLKSDFTKIITIKEETIKIFDELDSKILKLKEIYGEFIKNNKNNLFVFGLDSFHFQGKLIDIEFEEMKKLFAVINNRIYCEYFKLNNIIIQYIDENIEDKKMLEVAKVNNYPVYKDLEPFKIYEFDIIKDIHENIINSINSINTFLVNKNYELKSLQIKNSVGFNIDNFVHTFNFNNIMIKEKLQLFVTYIEFFHKMHFKYLKRFAAKMQLMISQINNDIKLDNEQNRKDKKKDMIKNFTNDNIDLNLLTEIKNGIGSMSEDENFIIDQTSLNAVITNQNDKASDEFNQIENSDIDKDILINEISESKKKKIYKKKSSSINK